MGTTTTYPTSSPEYWDGIAEEWEGPLRSWRLVSDAVNIALMEKWLGPDAHGHALKTDLFDEFTSDGLLPWLRNSFGQVSGVDLAPSIVRQVARRFPTDDLRAADVRHLPFESELFDAIVSNSTLDHLPGEDDIRIAVRELHRVLRPGGRLMLTLDNPANPVVRLRNAMSGTMRDSTHLVPYAVGATVGPRRLRAMLDEAGFEVLDTTAIFHSPRLAVVAAGALVDRLGPRARQRAARFWSRFEGLRHIPTRYLTGYFAAALARKR